MLTKSYDYVKNNIKYKNSDDTTEYRVYVECTTHMHTKAKKNTENYIRNFYYALTMYIRSQVELEQPSQTH